ncbi:MAG: ABC-type antimicrobial peptide transport system, ATPase component [Fibrobacteres bacterium]|nr:ABC-type antimicrobial peptide transport system, ATPase component [Fibrobacterota bacterium]
MNLVKCEELTKTYGSGDTRVMALRGVDLDILEGELFMLVGPSGSGKTTLISIIAAIMDQDSGKCAVLGNDLRSMNQKRKSRFRGTSIGYVFQVFNLLPALSACENVAVPLLINGVGRREAQTRAKALLDRVGLGERADSLPRQLSGGQQQRVAIARALVHDPKLVVCDEPTSNLDQAAGKIIMETLRQMAQKPDRAIIVVTHDQRIFPYADRIARMEDGKIIEVIAGKEKDALR